MPIMIIRPVLILNEVVTRTDKAQIRRQTHKFFRTVKKASNTERNNYLFRKMKAYTILFLFSLAMASSWYSQLCSGTKIVRQLRISV